MPTYLIILSCGASLVAGLALGVLIGATRTIAQLEAMRREGSLLAATRADLIKVGWEPERIEFVMKQLAPPNSKKYR